MTSRTGRRFFIPSFLGKLFLLTLPVMLLAHHLAQGSPSPPAKKVLLLYSYQAVLPANLEWDEAIRKALQDRDAQPVKFYTEFLDLSQFPDESYIRGLQNILQIKYSSQKIDLLIPVGDLAFSFLQAHGNALFPGAPIVFSAVAKQQVEALKPLANSTGVVAWIDVQGTLEAALRLQPGTRRVVAVGGTTKTDRVFQQIAREALRPYEGRLEVTFLTDLPMADILQRLSSLPLQTLVIYLSMFRDSTGHDFTPFEALQSVAQAGKAPVYGLWETLLGYGIVGGHLMSFREQGRLAGEMGRRILNGEKTENIPIVYESANVYEFDWRQLKRWGLKESDLPPGSLVRFKEPSLWETYKREIIVTVAAFCLLSLLTIGLLVNLGRRRRAERSLTRRLEFETMLAKLSALFVAVAANEVGREIDQGLKRLGKFLGIDRGILWRFSESQAEILSTNFWTAPGIEAKTPSPVREHFPWIRSQLLQDNLVVFSRPEDIPEEARLDRENLIAAGIKSALCIPLAAGGKFLGALTLSTLRSHKVWPPGLAHELRPIGEIFANALMRAQAEMELHQAELKYRIVADFNYDWEYWKHLDGTLRYVSPSCDRISGYQPEAFIKRPDLLRGIIVPEDRDLWDGHDCDSLEKPGTRECQFRVKRPDGTIRWVEHVCQPVTDAAGKYIGIRASNRDITLRKDSERQEQQHRDELAHVMRVATLGELTASLAHEFNQPLNAVLNNAQAALRFLNREQPDLAEVEAALQDIAQDGKRASAVIQRLRGFLKPGMMHLEAVDLNGVIQETVALVHNELLSHHITTGFSLAPDLPPVRGDRIQLQQVVLNLLLNAMEAMPGAETESHGIHLKTEQESPDFITASLEDTGKGLQSEALARIFEPFWTSKSGGLGLGLSISQSIISAHGGRLWARANADRGAAFFFTLPRYQGDSHEPHEGHSLRRG